MPLLLLLDAQQNRIREYVLDADAQLPSVLHLGCSLRDYCGGTVPEIIWADTSLLRALDILADRLPVQITVSSGFSLSRSLPFACGEGLTLHLSPQLPNPSVLLHTALSCGFTAICPPWRWGSTIDLYCNHHSWLLRPGQYCCQICFLQHALRSLGVPLSISGFLDGPTSASLEGFYYSVSQKAPALVDRPFLMQLFELTRAQQNATIQIAYGSGGVKHGL